ncbi:putative dna mismatch repair protein [Erysiphe neolycopersici]|uniref:Putative dna mismatch repair protein n=1 Tax=Erysiphe neolycopersici TaxID=212602 RepID=A0A420HW80_9PEZI|nr:putative dna mismatch repair protein [Erysiphe neolycopersici]
MQPQLSKIHTLALLRVRLAMSIVALPQHVTAQLNSSSSFTSLREVILELFKNSLDADCTKVEINVDYSRGNCVIEDNGIGILPSEFCESGGLGKPYRNSLASISAIALLTITSHHYLYQSHNTLCINHSVVLFRQLPALPQHHIHYDHGTRVTVHNLFGNIPVRVKQRAINFGKHGGNAREWKELLMGIIRLLFPWTRNHISITIRDKTTNNKIFIQTPIQNSATDSLIPKICSILRQASIVTAEDDTSWIPVRASTEGLKIMGAISLRPHASKRCQFLSFGIKPISQVENSLYDDINKLFCASNFGNIETVADKEDKNINCREDNKRFMQVGYTLRELKCVKGIEKWPKFYLKFLSEDIRENQISAFADIGFLRSSRGFSVKLKELLLELIWNFLKDNSFCPKQLSQKSLNKESLLKLPVIKFLRESKDVDSTPNCPVSSISSIAKRYKTIQNQFGSDVKLPSFRRNTLSSELSSDSLSKIKSGSSTRTFSTPKLNSTSKLNEPVSARRSVNIQLESTKNLVSNVGKSHAFTISDNKPFFIPEKHDNGNLHKEKASEDKSPTFPSNITFSSESTPALLQSPSNHQPIAQKEISALTTNPVTRKMNEISQKADFLTAPLKFPLETQTQGLVRQTVATKIRPNDLNSWVGRLLCSWNNPVYLPAEKSIPQVSLRSHNLLKQGFSSSQFLNCDVDLRFDDMATQLSGRISKRALRCAEFISQVDNKFILVKISAKYFNGLTHKLEELLVMIDQHAADERIRIESLFEDLCTPVKAMGLDPPCRVKSHILARSLSISLPSEEIEVLLTFKDHFSSWGIIYKIPVQGPCSTQNNITRTLTILSLPPVIAERCQQHPHLLVSLLRKEIWKLQDSNNNLVPVLSTKTSWIDRIHACPAGMLDLLNARACRSAIMFNDELSPEQCRILVKRLADCSFPFQCAHGRPSMVPLATLSTLDFDYNHYQMWNGYNSAPQISFGVQFKKWKKLKKSEI